MKKVFIVLLCTALLITNISLATSSNDNSIQFTPTLAKALGIKNWFSTGVNRALLAFSLGVSAADDRVLGREDVLLAFMKNPTFVGKDKGSDSLIAATLTDEEWIIIYSAASMQQAIVTTFPNQSGSVSMGAISLERALSETCSDLYQITEDEMKTCIEYIQSQL